MKQQRLGTRSVNDGCLALNRFAATRKEETKGFPSPQSRTCFGFGRRGAHHRRKGILGLLVGIPQYSLLGEGMTPQFWYASIESWVSHVSQVYLFTILPHPMVFTAQAPHRDQRRDLAPRHRRVSLHPIELIVVVCPSTTAYCKSCWFESITTTIKALQPWRYAFLLTSSWRN